MKKLQEEYIFLKPEDKDFSLILRDGNKIIFSSKKGELRPLLECVVRWFGRVDNASLTDKIVGGAAARLIVRSGMIGRVTAGIISEKGIEHLSDHSIPVKWRVKTAAIIRDDGQGICPMEELSNRYPDDEDFFPALFHHFSIDFQFKESNH